MALVVIIVCIPPCDLTSASWSTTNAIEGEAVNLNVAGTNCDGKTIDFEIWEKDGFLNPDDSVTINPSSIVFSGTSSSGSWTAEWQDDTDGFQSNPPEYYFIASVSDGSDEIKSGLLYVEVSIGVCDEITICSDSDVYSCGNCPGVAEASVPSYIDCAEGYNCRCEWDETEGCQAKWDNVEGTCTYITDSSIDPLGCEDDGWLNYSWVSEWTWDSLNTYTPEPDPNNGDYVEDPLESDEWHYDPLKRYLTCTDGSDTVLCPGTIQLPFFGTWGIIITIGLIVMIYVILNFKKSKSKKKK